MLNRESKGRIEIPVHYDAWMRGARFGTIIGFRFGKPHQSDYLLIQMDHPQIRKFLKLWEPDWEYARIVKESQNALS